MVSGKRFGVHDLLFGAGTVPNGRIAGLDSDQGGVFNHCVASERTIECQAGWSSLSRSLAASGAGLARDGLTVRA